MTKPRRIYLLNPKDLNPETIAVTFAKTSRSPQSFDEIAAELSDEKTARFHEKWVVGYGHSSVAEHAILHIALENVSRLAIETIEGNRLASYTEKSTRFQLWEGDAFYIPDELRNHPLHDRFINTCQALFKTYKDCLPRVKAWLCTRNARKKTESEKSYERRIQSAAVDICRFLLPAASLANVGITINARSLEYAICKMLSSPLKEVQAIGVTLREVGQSETPTLIKYARCNAYLVNLREKLRTYTKQMPQERADEDFNLLDWDKNGQDKVLAAMLFRFDRRMNFQCCMDHVLALSTEEKEQLIKIIMSERGKFDQPLREFEYAQITFDAVMDQGAYFEFKRHRMMSQTAQSLTGNLGFAVPVGIGESGCEKVYIDVMQQAANLYHQIASWNPDVASYIIPNGFNRRVLFTLNLRQAFHFCRLRAAPTAHFSIRRVAQHISESINQIYPLLGSYLDVPDDETPEKIKARYFSAISFRNNDNFNKFA
ncbi:MAG: FAD-dependent thymidylate synthase [Chloroflexota bacterium]|nr:FAD-dependent thymidylate synthase [Chloroflexota bacterium]